MVPPPCSVPLALSLVYFSCLLILLSPHPPPALFFFTLFSFPIISSALLIFVSQFSSVLDNLECYWSFYNHSLYCQRGLPVWLRWQRIFNTGDVSLIPGLWRLPGEGNGYPLQYCCLENPMDRGAWWATVHEVTDSWIGLSNKYFHFLHFKLWVSRHRQGDSPRDDLEWRPSVSAPRTGGEWPACHLVTLSEVPALPLLRAPCLGFTCCPLL